MACRSDVRLALSIVVLGVALVACSSERAPAPTPTPTPTPTPLRIPSGEATSTIARADYIGPDACGECHPVQHAQWSASLHRTMNQRASGPEVIGTPATLAYAGGMMVFARDPQGFTMSLKKGTNEARYRITRTIGTRYLQEYVGIEDGKTMEVRGAVRLVAQGARVVSPAVLRSVVREGE
jgi:hypothetical protein